MRTDADSSQEDVSQVSRKINLCFAYESCRRNPSLAAPATGHTCSLSPRVICLGRHFPPALTFRFQILASRPGASLNPHINKIFFFFSFVRLLVQQNEAFFFFLFFFRQRMPGQRDGRHQLRLSLFHQAIILLAEQTVCLRFTAGHRITFRVLVVTSADG